MPAKAAGKSIESGTCAHQNDYRKLTQSHHHYHHILASLLYRMPSLPPLNPPQSLPSLPVLNHDFFPSLTTCHPEEPSAVPNECFCSGSLFVHLTLVLSILCAGAFFSCFPFPYPPIYLFICWVARIYICSFSCIWDTEWLFGGSVVSALDDANQTYMERFLYF